MSLISFWCIYCQLYTDFQHCSEVSIVDSEKANAGYVCYVGQARKPEVFWCFQGAWKNPVSMKWARAEI